jgi:hypothetical protein
MQHHAGQVIGRHLIALAEMADVGVLAKGAEKIAGTEEDGSGAPRPCQRCFLSEMGVKAGHFGPNTGSANAQLAGETIRMAFPRAQTAIFQQVKALFHSGQQQPFPVKLQIGWFVMTVFHSIP